MAPCVRRVARLSPRPVAVPPRAVERVPAGASSRPAGPGCAPGHPVRPFGVRRTIDASRRAGWRPVDRVWPMPPIARLVPAAAALVLLAAGCGDNSDEPLESAQAPTSAAASPSPSALPSTPEARQPHILVFTATGTARI